MDVGGAQLDTLRKHTPQSKVQRVVASKSTPLAVLVLFATREATHITGFSCCCGHVFTCFSAKIEKSKGYKGLLDTDFQLPYVCVCVCVCTPPLICDVTAKHADRVGFGREDREDTTGWVWQLLYSGIVAT